MTVINTDREVSKFEELIADLQEISDYFADDNACLLDFASKPPDQHQHAEQVVDKAIDILHMIHSWAKAYPEDIFLPVDWEQVHRALRQVDISGSAVGADCMRYVVTTMAEQIEKIAS